MMTRKRYCEAVIRDYMYEYNVEDPKDLIPKIFSSSTMAIALQELGYINPTDTPTENEYTNSRGGIMKSYATKVGDDIQVEILTFREFLDLLPNELPKEEEE